MHDIPTWTWLVFGAVLGAFLALDLYVHRGERHDSKKTAMVWAAIWLAVGLSFAGFVWLEAGGRATVHYLGAYLIEESLSVDNLFVFLIIFRMLEIPMANQRAVLSWGIFGALFLRGLFIFAGAAAIERYDAVLYVFAAVLFWAAWRTLRENPAEQKENRFVRWLAGRLPVTRRIHDDHFVAREDGRRVATPLLVALLGLELSDVVFAVDSVPAAFSITHVPFIVYTSNAFAILGLRSLYLVLAHTLPRMRYLHYGLSAVLTFAALKLALSDWLRIPAWLSIAFTVSALGVAIAASLHHDRRAGAEARPRPD